MNRHIRNVAILGSGVMGSRIAALFAGIGIKVLLLDMPNPESNINDGPILRNQLVQNHLKNALNSNPSPIFHKKYIKNIEIGNFEDDFPKIKDADWIIEVVIERLDIKKNIFEKVDSYRKPDSIVSSNTSGIPIHLMTEGRSDNFKKNFLGTHFFNPPRYLRLLEIIPTKYTDKELINFLLNYGDSFLGKTTVLAKDTPAFIGNRIGVFSISIILNYLVDHNITIEEIDKLTGPIVGRPKSATFRTADVVGIDTLALVSNSLAEAAENDPHRNLFKTPNYIDKMVENKWLGAKTNQGFYKKIKLENGISEIQALDIKNLSYHSPQKVKIPLLDQLKNINNIEERIPILLSDNSNAGHFYKHTILPLFSYASHRIPEIADHIYQIDQAIEGGFNWEIGPFRLWDALGVKNGVQMMKEIGWEPADWVNEMQEAGVQKFYKYENGKAYFYNIESKEYKQLPGTDEYISINYLGADKIVWKNTGATLYDIGDKVLNLEFHTKMNTIGGEILQAINQSIQIAENEYKGLVISNNGENFSAGANVGLIYMMAIEQDYEELNFAIKQFQDTMMRIRYSSIPVIAAPHNMTLGGGCELCLHADMVVANSELYMGLVEFGVGVIPGGGGTKEFTLRLSDELKEGDVRLNLFREKFLTIGQAKVSTSAEEAFELGYLQNGKDIIVKSRRQQLSEAKSQVLRLHARGYTQPIPRTDILVLGKEALGLAYLGADSMQSGNYISEHDKFISQKLAYVMSGGELSSPTLVSEKYLLDLERKAFLELCTQRKTLERLQSIITTGKVLRN